MAIGAATLTMTMIIFYAFTLFVRHKLPSIIKWFLCYFINTLADVVELISESVFDEKRKKYLLKFMLARGKKM